MRNALSLISFALLTFCSVKAQLNTQSKEYTYKDTLRGSIGPERNWWDVQHYTVYIKPDFTQKRLEGKVDIRFKVLSRGSSMQIDLQEPMQLEKAYLGDAPMSYSRNGDAYFISIPTSLEAGKEYTLALKFSGQVKVAVRPPWDGGWIFTKDQKGRPWMSVACQGLGASVWYPCKDHQSDEPDKGALLRIVAPDSLVAVGNGRLKNRQTYEKGWTTWDWEVTSPINNYNIVPYIGNYVEFNERYAGESGNLDCSYWVLDYELEKAQKQFTQVRPMLQAFEHWFGPYPFYADGYKLVQSPHLGMEHQSAVAYGNGFQNGYRGRDLSQSGWGLKWDFIIIHESGHEWFGNNITTAEVADMWVHEGFTNYSETLFTSHQHGVKAGNEYVQGTRALIQNDIPIIGKYGVNEEGSGDMYYKGGNLVHYVRQLCNTDESFRLSMRKMNEKFRHAITISSEVEQFWSNETGKNLRPLFDQYLRTTQIPTFEYIRTKTGIQFRWSDCLSSFNIPVAIFINGERKWVTPNAQWQNLAIASKSATIEMDKNFYVGFRELH